MSAVTAIGRYRFDGPDWKKLLTDLRAELRHIEARQAAGLVDRIAHHLWSFAMVSQGMESERRDHLERIRANADALLRSLGPDFDFDNPSPDALPPLAFPMRSIEQLHDIEARSGVEIAFDAARRASVKAVGELILQVDAALARGEPRRGPGRARADQYGVLAAIAADYLEFAGEAPTSTPGGPFANIAMVALSWMNGRMPRDASRQIKAALDSIRR